MMKIVCAWCERELGEKEPLEDKDTTHGMCFRCFLRMRREARELQRARIKGEAPFSYRHIRRE